MGTAAVDLPEGGNAPAATTTNAKGKKSAKNAQAEATARKDAITRKSGATDLIAVDMVGLGFVSVHDAMWVLAEYVVFRIYTTRRGRGCKMS